MTRILLLLWHCIRLMKTETRILLVAGGALSHKQVQNVRGYKNLLAAVDFLQSACTLHTSHYRHRMFELPSSRGQVTVK